MANKIKAVLIASSGSFTVPSDFGSFVSFEVIGEGGATGTQNGRGAGGGGYSKTTGITGITAGSTIYYNRTFTTSGYKAWIATSNTEPTSTSTGALANGGNKSTGGSTAGAIGTVVYAGGNAGAFNTDVTDGSGGGGAGGPSGAGKNGGTGYYAFNKYGGGGGGANNGSVGSDGTSSIGGNGGNGPSGSGGGAGSAYAGGNATAGSGGGGGGSGSGLAGGNGASQDLWLDINGTYWGPGGGGGGATGSSYGGAGASGGGGGGGHSTSASSVNSGYAIAIFTYEPAATGNFFFMMGA